MDCDGLGRRQGVRWAVRDNRLSGTGAPVADSRYLPGTSAGKPLPRHMSSTWLAMPADGTVRRWLEFLAHHRLVLAYSGLMAAKTAQ